jgi:hypothetical protein
MFTFGTEKSLGEKLNVDIELEKKGVNSDEMHWDVFEKAEISR